MTAPGSLDRILSAANEGIVALDRSLRYIFINDAAVRLVGIPREAAIGRTPRELFPPEVLEEILPILQGALETMHPATYEAVHPDGHRWFENRVYPSAEGLAIFFTDITARKHAEESARRTQDSHRLLVALTDATRGLRRPEDLMREVVTRVGQHLRVGGCTYGEIDPSQEHVIVQGDFVAGVPSLAGRHRLDDFGPLLIADLKAGHTVVLPDVAADPRTAGEGTLAAYAAIGTRAVLCVPLVKDGRLVATFLLHHPEPREWSRDDVTLMEQVAERTWFAVESARAAAALRENRDVLALAMRGGRMGAWARNLVTGEVWWSRELEELFGLPPGGFEGTEAGFFSFVHEEDRAAVEAAVGGALAAGSDYLVQFRFRHVSGEWRWMDGRGRAVYDGSGRPTSLYGLGIDITEQKAIEREIEASRQLADSDAQRLSLALAAARLGDWSWDVRTDVVTLSPRAADIFRLPAGPVMTWAAMRELLHDEDRERARLAVEASVERRSDYLVEYRLTNGGRVRWVSVSGRPRYDDEGRIAGMLGVVQDITRDRLLVVVDDAVRSLTDPEAITYTAARLLGEHLDVNRCAYASVEEDEDTFLLTGNYTSGAHSIVGRYRFRQFGAECLRLMRAGEPYVVSDSAADPRIDDEDRRAYELTAIRAVICVPILKSARFVAAMAVHEVEPRAWAASDVELVQQVASRCWESIERARVERDRAALLEAAEAANRAKDEFLAMLGHELRNPLSPIVTALQLMKLRDGSAAERERTVIERQVSHLTRLVDDLLDVSRIARGKVELKREIVEVADVVARAIEVASPLIEERHHAITLDVPAEGLAVDADPARLAQVVSNLLTNAAKYTPPGGRVIISSAVEQGEVVLRVRDTGIGIPPEVLPRVFDLFVQGQQEIDRAKGGLGLGLTIVRSLVERHGGTVEARSDGEDRGSEFLVRLPHVQRPASAPDRQVEQGLPTALGARAGARILIVDDNEDAADMLALALGADGYATTVAYDGPAALRLAQGSGFDAACLDIGLPVMDGYELAARLRELPGYARIRLIAVTGYGQPNDRARAAAAGFDHHMVKPVDLDVLARLLADVRRDTDTTT